MGDGGFDALLIAELVLESGLSRPRPASVAATAVGEDDHAAGVGIGELSVVAPPCGDAIGGEDGGVAGGSDEDGAGIGAQVVDAIGDGHAASEGTEVVVVDLLGIAVPFWRRRLLNLPISSFFLVSMLMMGMFSLAPRRRRTVMCANWASLCGWLTRKE